ncbi:Propanoyl-CoA C-acyltransferase [Haloterrigena turkmenica DSM 5511]|uniref:Propanoyl-CoA C-acyltransferase n=1 Tax=Haloterrigena turkmenica (strain ATCC 51198 / DSM 5511 / JCM 9101 / NCIMB 13204 / VKM B-1734 / 4k) TaxID=543526 RepID=D2RWU3_HALTV|nr:thiolase family protein [Haloterrigena turkmenica]ADB61594.1 Propanoyl-CoA C-acyltransferase [Haloterrigena turkmenica DSM 5511]
MTRIDSASATPAGAPGRNVAIAGAAMTPFGPREASLLELLAEAGTDCLADAPIGTDEVDHLFVARSGGAYEGQSGLAAALAGELGIRPAHAVAIEQTSSSGAAAVYEAWKAIASGTCEVALAVGGERMTHLSTATATDIVSGITHPAEYRHGITIPSFAGLTARRYLERYDAPRTALAKVAVKNHAHGVANPKAHFRREIDVETVLDSPVVADPLRLYDFCPISDGSAALLLVAESALDGGEHVHVDGIAGATGTHVVHERDDLTAMSAVVDAGRRVYDRAGRTPDDIDALEVHDMFTILELLQLEGLGVADRGESWRLVERNATERGGELPVNTSGGLKSKGHPIAASGVAQLVELYDQLIGRAGDRQVDADVGMACNVGGFGNCAIATILSAP